MAGNKLGILLTTSPEQQDMHSVIRICEAAIESGKEVKLFMMCDGVYGSNCAALTGLIPKGVEVSQCHHNAEERKIEEEHSPVKSASQYIFSNIIEDVDKLITFC
ncbi:MAG: DsrE family protein [Nitrospirae bacterium]|nr:DsrE family protein [Nitrospirota bacterium]MBI5695256.1 DsrE family protein [Nitrospirota bacterium]